MTALIALLLVVAWLAIGYMAGRKAAPIAYHRYRRRYPSLAHGDVHFGGSEAAGVLFLNTLLGPFGWMYPLTFGSTWHVIPDIRDANREAEAARRRAELADLQRQIDEAHRHLGIAPLKRDAS